MRIREFNLDSIFDEMELKGPGRESVKDYMQELFKKFGEDFITNDKLYLMVGSFYDGFAAGAKWVLRG